HALGQLQRGQARAALVEHDTPRAFRNAGFEAGGLCRHQLLGGLGPARLGLHRFQLEPQLRRKALGEILVGGVGPGWLTLAHRHQQQLHECNERFFAGAFLAGAFFAGAFFAAVLLTPTVRVTPGLAAAFFAAGFLAGAFLAAAFFGAAPLAGANAFFAAGFFAGASAGAALTSLTGLSSIFILTGLSPQISSRW